jgi:hypothetical protein
MARFHSKAVVFASILSAAALSTSLFAQYEKGKPSPSPSGPAPSSRPTRPYEVAPGPWMTATLVDLQEKAKKQAATVRVTVKGVRIVDPALSKEKPIRGQGHLHYQVDDGPIIATTALKLSFHGLKPGTHSIMVTLAANDHTPIGQEQKLAVTIP